MSALVLTKSGWRPAITRVSESGGWQRTSDVVVAGKQACSPFYAPDSFFNRPLGPSDVASADQTPAQHLANMSYYGYQGSDYAWHGYTGPGYGWYNWPWSVGFNGPGTYSLPVFCVSPSDPMQNITTQPVGLYYTDSNGSCYKYDSASISGLDVIFADGVPIPDKTLCPMITGTYPYQDIWAGGTDGFLLIWNLDTDEMWSFWVMSNSSAAAQALTGCTWNAKYGGYIPNASLFSGVYPHNWGSIACSLGDIGGMITMQDLRDVNAGGSINHALAFACGYTGGSGTQVAPATRTDGPGPYGNYVATIPSGFPNAGQPNPAYHMDVVYESQRFRFPSSVDVTVPQIANYPLARAMAEAIRDYGAYVNNTTASIAYAFEDDRTIGSPYHMQGPDAPHPWHLTWPGGDLRYGGQGAVSSGFTVLNNLPWSQLQVLTPVAG